MPSPSWGSRGFACCRLLNAVAFVAYFAVYVFCYDLVMNLKVKMMNKALAPFRKAIENVSFASFLVMRDLCPLYKDAITAEEWSKALAEKVRSEQLKNYIDEVNNSEEIQ